MLLGLILLLLLIGYGGPYLSSVLERNYREKIDKNAAIVKGIIYRKKTHKGKSVHFRYSWRQQTFTNHEQSNVLYRALDIGDSIELKLDTLNPSNSYVFFY
jgi:hypothetical protein